jgi:hypothetical protein
MYFVDPTHINGLIDIPFLKQNNSKEMNKT